jgi:hypothetical protein
MRGAQIIITQPTIAYPTIMGFLCLTAMGSAALLWVSTFR